MSEKILKVETNLSTVSKRVNSQFDGCTTEEVLGSLVVSKRMGDHCDKLYRTTKNHIEQKVSPEDVEKVLETTEDPKKFLGNVVTLDTLFGVEYLLGETRWEIKTRGKTNAKTVLINAANSNPVVKDALIKAGILDLNPTINYAAIHGVIDSLSDKSKIPADLAILGSVIELVETDRTVRVSTIKEKVSDTSAEGTK